MADQAIKPTLDQARALMKVHQKGFRSKTNEARKHKRGVALILTEGSHSRFAMAIGLAAGTAALGGAVANGISSALVQMGRFAAGSAEALVAARIGRCISAVLVGGSAAASSGDLKGFLIGLVAAPNKAISEVVSCLGVALAAIDQGFRLTCRHSSEALRAELDKIDFGQYVSITQGGSAAATLKQAVYYQQLYTNEADIHLRARDAAEEVLKAAQKAQNTPAPTRPQSESFRAGSGFLVTKVVQGNLIVERNSVLITAGSSDSKKGRINIGYRLAGALPHGGHFFWSDQPATNHSQAPQQFKAWTGATTANGTVAYDLLQLDTPRYASAFSLTLSCYARSPKRWLGAIHVSVERS